MADHPLFVGILGSGAREHAMAWRIQRDARADGHSLILAFYPGHPFLKTLGPCFDRFTDLVRYGHTMDARRVLLCGSEMYAGYGQDLEGWRVWGPSLSAGSLETSKVFSKKWMMEYQVPTADLYGVVHGEPSLVEFCATSAHAFPMVMKYDGLLGGKGVAIVNDAVEAQGFYKRCAAMAGDQFSQTFLFEQVLRGSERSLFLFLDAHGRAQSAPPSMDFKAKYDGNRGPNTGGMGSFTPAPLPMEEKSWQTFLHGTLIPRIADGLRRSALLYPGVLYVGLMFDPTHGPKVLEFNVRLGDPEAQTLLPAMDTSFLQLVLDALDGALVEPIKLKPSHGIGGIVCASTDYGEDGVPPPPPAPLDASWLHDCPYDVFWAKLKPAQASSDYSVGSGRAATVVYPFDPAAPDDVIVATENKVREWIVAHQWPHMHFRKDLVAQYLSQRSQYAETSDCRD